MGIVPDPRRNWAGDAGRWRRVPAPAEAAQTVPHAPDDCYRLLFLETRDGAALHEVVPDGCGALDCRFLEVNPAFEAITGLEAAAITGKRLVEVIPHGGADWMERSMRVALTGTPETFESSAAVPGRRIEVDLYRLQPGQIASVVRDITAQHHAQEALRAELGEAADVRRDLETRLHQAQQMEAVGRQAAGVAHDFENFLLMAISGNVALALDSLEPGDPSRFELEQIAETAARASALSSGLLAAARGKVLPPTTVDLRALVDDLEPVLRQLLGSRVSLEIRNPSRLGAVVADPSQLEQVVVNLVINARDAMADGGVVTIETAEVEIDDAVTPGQPGVAPGRYVALTISDTGAGMDVATLNRVFEPFFTTKPPGSGTGLGLATVAEIVNQAGGTIRADSEPDRGSRFRVFLRRASP